MATKKIQRTFWVNPKEWLRFQKQSLDLGKSSNQRIETFIDEENKYKRSVKQQ